MNTTATALPAEIAEHHAAQAQARILTDMLARSTTDSAFRQLLLADPHAAFAQSGLPLPPAFDVVFIENAANLTVVLPDAIDALTELNEDELLQFNGGSASTAASARISAATTASTSVISASIGAVLGAAVVLGIWYIAKQLD